MHALEPIDDVIATFRWRQFGEPVDQRRDSPTAAECGNELPGLIAERRETDEQAKLDRGELVQRPAPKGACSLR